jgi:hypothetical protein
VWPLLLHPLPVRLFSSLCCLHESGYRNQHEKNDDPVDASASNSSAENALPAVLPCAHQSYDTHHEASENEEGASASKDYHAHSIALNRLVAKNIDTNTDGGSKKAERCRLSGE